MLKQIYEMQKTTPKIGTRFLLFVAIILLGGILGCGSEWLEYNIYEDISYRDSAVLNAIKLVLDNFSVWIFAATLIAYFSWDPISAGVHTFSFFIAMCIAYFIPKHMHYGYSIDLQLLFWSIVALISIGAAVVIWFSRVGGWTGAIIKSLPIAAILVEFVYTVHYYIDYYSPFPGQPPEPLKWLLQPDHILQLCCYLVFMILLLVILAKGKEERLRVSLSSLCFGAVLSTCCILVF